MNKKNLQILANHLKTIDPQKFDMSTFNRIHAFPEIGEEYTCNTAGCIAGHAPMIPGFEFNEKDTKGVFDTICWAKYIHRIFDISEVSDENLWLWIFGGNWSAVDNTIKGAVKRIEYTLKYGLPENWYAQQEGLLPLSYLDIKPKFAIESEVEHLNMQTTIHSYVYLGKQKYFYRVTAHTSVVSEDNLKLINNA